MNNTASVVYEVPDDIDEEYLGYDRFDPDAKPGDANWRVAVPGSYDELNNDYVPMHVAASYALDILQRATNFDDGIMANKNPAKVLIRRHPHYGNHDIDYVRDILHLLMYLGAITPYTPFRHEGQVYESIRVDMQKKKITAEEVNEFRKAVEQLG